MSNNPDAFVDAVYDAIETLYKKDKNVKKQMLGGSPAAKLIGVYSDWLANNLGLSPRLAANSIYRDTMRVGYLDFPNRALKKGVQLKNEPGLNLIYGDQKQIDQANKTMQQIQANDPTRHQILLTALQKVKQLSDTVKPAKNIFGKTTAQAKKNITNFKMPTMQTFLLFQKMSNQQLNDYIKKIQKAL